MNQSFENEKNQTQEQVNSEKYEDFYRKFRKKVGEWAMKSRGEYHVE